MKLSQLFTRTSKTTPADEQSKNAQLLIKAGFIHKDMAGVYTFLPLGKMVLENVTNIIREEMNAVGGNEISMTALQPQEPWLASNRWDDKIMDVWFRTKLANGQELGLAPTHEEPLTLLMSRFIASYKDLPAYVYQFQTKFRNELRAKSGLLRGREFLMKDLYSFNCDQQQHDSYYEKVALAYQKIYERLGIRDITYKTFASGGSFSQFSHEFQTVSPIGEDTIYIDKKSKTAINQEVMNDETLTSLGLNKDDLEQVQGVEVGNIFTLGTKYSEPLGLRFTDKDGVSKPVFMGSYGIGVSRLVGLLAEHFADDRGLIWPENVAPFKVYLAQLGEEPEVSELTQHLYDELGQKDITVLWDDRDERPGVKFADADLMGIPYRLVISQKTLQSGQFELKKRVSTEAELLDKESLIKKLAL